MGSTHEALLLHTKVWCLCKAKHCPVVCVVGWISSCLFMEHHFSHERVIEKLKLFRHQFSSFQFSCSVVPNSLWPHELQHARPPCPSPTPRVYPNSCPSSRWCQPAISSSVMPFSSCLQSFTTSGSFPWVSSSHQVAKVLKLQVQHRSFKWIFRTDFL